MRSSTWIVCLLLIAASSFTAHAATIAHLWSQGFGSPNSDNILSVATDAAGNVYVTGYFSGTINVGGSNLVSAGLDDIFLAKYNSAGVHRWSQRFGGIGNDQPRGIAADADGNVYLAGSFIVTVNFGGSNLTSAGINDVFLARYSSSGTHLWSMRFGSTGDDQARGVAVDPSGNALLTGYFNGTVSFGGSPLVSAGGADMVIAKYDVSGVHQWSQRYGDVGGQLGLAVAADASGNVLVTGSMVGSVNFGGGLLSGPGGNAFLVKFNGSGLHQWSQSFGDASLQQGNSVATDASGNVLITGFMQGAVDFGGGSLSSTGFGDAFLAKFTAGGAHLWSKHLGNTGSSTEGLGVAVDASGNNYLTGYFSSAVDFGGGLLTSGGESDVIIAKYDAAGVHRWSQRFGGVDFDYGYSVAADALGDVVLCGAFVRTVSFGGSSFASVGNSQDAFLARYSGEPQEPEIQSIVDIGNDQGRQVKIRFARSAWDDATVINPVTRYVAFLRDDAPPAAALPRYRVIRDEGWTEVGSVGAFAKDSYGIDVPTIGDSTEATGQYYSTFFIRAMTAAPATHYDSEPDSGYSVDNLAPGVPQSFAFAAGQLTWDISSAQDFDFFTVYGSNTDSFASATVVDYSTSPTMDVSASPYTFYFVTATDVSGNEGKPARVTALSDATGAPKSYVLSVSNYPNPFNPRTTVNYTLPSRGAVTIAIYDARGARSATLVSGADRAAGAYSIDWNGHTDNGAPVSSGVYFLRIEHNGATRSKKMVVLK